ncbi:MAG: CinA family protein [Nitrospirae bacterium]|nr:CinA family protein [Nitrospirota bacterium]
MLLETGKEEIESLCALTERVVKAAALKKLSIATAESCTGGMIAEFITSVSGSSAVFCGGAVTYSNALKEIFLGVSPETLRTYGAVSPQTALEMSLGIREATTADFGLAVTGIAGPTGGTAEKPVGLVYISLKGPGPITTAIKCNFNGSRHRIRFEAAKKAISLLYEALMPCGEIQ